jgi:hypothetical protein
MDGPLTAMREDGRWGDRLGEASQLMTIGSSTSSTSFWQQDQNYWSNVQAENQATSAGNALITEMGSAVSNEAQGLASIANKTALTRVQAQLTAALQSAVTASQASSTTPTSTTGSAATGTGTVPLSTNTSLLTLGIPQNGIITVSDGTNTTTFSSTGTDTVGDLINAINNPNIAANAQVTATLNTSGQLVLTADNLTDSISVGGTFASDVGFGSKNASFQPTAPTTPAASSTGSSTTSSSSSTAASSTSGASSTTGSTATTTPSAVFYNSSAALQTGGTAETLLAGSGLGGNLIDLLA